MTKLQYFQDQLNKAVKSNLPEKAGYYRRRVTEVTQNSEGSQPVGNTKCTETNAEMLQKAIKVWNVRSHSASTRHAFLAGKGIPEAIIFQALSFIGSGKLLSDM